MTIDSLHSKLIKLWEAQSISERVPLFYSNLNTDALLFIGLNPSFSIKGFNQILRGSYYENILGNLENFFAFKNFTKDKIKDFQKIGEISREKYPYFSKFKDLATTINCDWEHIDLLYMRQTTQKEVEKLLHYNSDFIYSQINLTIELIMTLNPRIIVVENAFVSRLLKDKLDLEWNEKLGTYRFKNVPIFFSGMLTGQRALDLGSYERLMWHLKYVNKRI